MLNCSGHAGAVFFSLVFLALTSLTTVDLLVNERGLVVKESLGGYYRPVSYYLSKGESCRFLLWLDPFSILSPHLLTVRRRGPPQVSETDVEHCCHLCS